MITLSYNQLWAYLFVPMIGIAAFMALLGVILLVILWKIKAILAEIGIVLVYIHNTLQKGLK